MANPFYPPPLGMSPECRKWPMPSWGEGVSSKQRRRF
jgi:hypothetical protein